MNEKQQIELKTKIVGELKKYVNDKGNIRAWKIANIADGLVKNIACDPVLAIGDSLKTDEFRIHLPEPDELKIVATGVGFDNIRIEPVSANCIIVHACS